jgi:molybdenum cofactor cytidylyltransferase
VNPRPHPAAVILAAGASSRMGRPKPLLQFEGQTFLDSLIQRFEGICEPIIVVLGYAADEVRSGIARSAQVEIVGNPAPERGMLSSLQCGVARVPHDALFTPVDLPGISRATIETLASTEGPVVIPAYKGRKGHPVRVSRDVIAELLALPVGAQARDALRRHDAQLIAVDDPRILHDVDTPADYYALLAGALSGAL